jgi:hypothetical protein
MLMGIRSLVALLQRQLLWIYSRIAWFDFLIILVLVVC